MRLLRIGTVYRDYWTNFYRRRRSLSKRDYRNQLHSISDDFFAQSDSYSYYLNEIGYQCEEVMANVEPLQRAWAKENGIRWSQGDFVTRLPMEFARRFRPDIVFINNYSVFSSEWIEQLRTLCPSIRLAAAWCSSPISSFKTLSGYDLILTSSPELLNRMGDCGLKCELLRHAFDPRILSKLDNAHNKHMEISFIGSLNFGDDFHNKRAHLIRELMKHFDLALFCPNTQGNWVKRALRHSICLLANVLKTVGVPKQVIKRIPLISRGISYPKNGISQKNADLITRTKGARYGIAMYETLRRSRLSLNVHIDMAGSFTGNMRLFEATGVGSCLLTDWKEDLPSLFAPETEVVTYKSVEDCIAKVRCLLGNQQQCAKIAQNGQRRTLKDHTYKQRVTELDYIFKKQLRAAVYRQGKQVR